MVAPTARSAPSVEPRRAMPVPRAAEVRARSGGERGGSRDGRASARWASQRLLHARQRRRSRRGKLRRHARCRVVLHHGTLHHPV